MTLNSRFWDKLKHPRKHPKGTSLVRIASFDVVNHTKEERPASAVREPSRDK